MIQPALSYSLISQALHIASPSTCPLYGSSLWHNATHPIMIQQPHSPIHALTFVEFKPHAPKVRPWHLGLAKFPSADRITLHPMSLGKKFPESFFLSLQIHLTSKTKKCGHK